MSYESMPLDTSARRYPTGWRKLPLRLTIAVAPSGLISLDADVPRNLGVTGTSLQEAFEAFVTFVDECARLGKPFKALEGVKLRSLPPSDAERASDG